MSNGNGSTNGSGGGSNGTTTPIQVKKEPVVKKEPQPVVKKDSNGTSIGMNLCDSGLGDYSEIESFSRHFFANRSQKEGSHYANFGQQTTASD